MQEPFAQSHDTTQPIEPAELVRRLPHRPGVYLMIDGHGRVLYVGKARDLRRRVGSYFQGRAHDAKTTAMLRLVADVQVTVTRTESEALMLEFNLIKRHRPRFNVVLRDDKSYPFIHLSTDHEFPRLSFYRGPRRGAGRLFGPYPSAVSVRETLNQLHKLFQIRQCEDSYFANRARPCLQYQLQRCTAPCVGLISREDYARDVEHARMFLEGGSDKVTASLVERMERAAAELQFERAAQYRDQLAKLRNVQASELVSRSSGEFDAVGLAVEQGLFCVSVVFFRAGRLLGNRAYFPKTVEGADEDEVVRAFLLQYYGARDVPREVLVSRPVPEGATLAEMFSERMGRRVQIKWRVRGDRRRWVDMAVTNARHAAAQRYQANASTAAQLEALGEVLALDEPPRRVECFDISHTSGEATVASCVAFGPDGPLKSDYRRFNIGGVAPGDDYAALAQALRRRFARARVTGDGGRGGEAEGGLGSERGRDLGGEPVRGFAGEPGSASGAAADGAVREAAGHAVREAAASAEREATGSAVREAADGAVPEAAGNAVREAAASDGAQAAREAVRMIGGASREGPPLPDLLLIDGGRGQLTEARAVLSELDLELPVVAVAKGEGRRPGRERLYVPERREPVRLSPASPALHLIQQVRDEAHRFAVAGHRARRRKQQRGSPLERIKGLGPKRRRALLTQFGGLQGLARAGVDDLAAVKGISRQMAQAIYEHLHSG